MRRVAEALNKEERPQFRQRHTSHATSAAGKRRRIDSYFTPANK
jgi:hypothetical protein